VAELALAPEARGPDARAARQRRDGLVPGRDEGIARVAALERGRDREPVRQEPGMSFMEWTAMSAWPSACALEFLDEETLAARRGEAPVLDAVALGDDRDQAHDEAGMAPARRARRCSACQRASRLRRVAMRTGTDIRPFCHARSKV
jgi:hypothetical protein